ncbi:MAG: hypothetical protein GC206_14820 [Alphaproteobacteria bacterium]|nr:hypothetical protein [Alphaproteobacteria bacterium]
MRYIIMVCAAGVSLMAAGPLAVSAGGAAAAPIVLPPSASQDVAAPAASKPGAPAGSVFAAASLDDLMGGEFDVPVGEGDAAADTPPPVLAERIRTALFRHAGCPGEQQALTIISAATRDSDAAAASSALRIVSGANDLCGTVGAAVDRSTIAAEAFRSNAAPLSPAGGGAPGGTGGPGYGSNG